MGEIEFRDPPKVNSESIGLWVQTLAPLIDHPERWAVIATRDSITSARNLAANLRNGRVRRPEGRWEFRQRGAEVFARYLGPDENETKRGPRVVA